MKTLVIIPTYNERKSLPWVVRQVLGQGEEIHLLVVDDNSPDGTGQVADQLAQEFPSKVWVLHRPEKSGLGSAYIAGFQWGLQRGFDLLMEMDGDGSHDPAELPVFQEASQSADVVVGSRYLGGVRVLDWPLRRLILSYVANAATRWISGLPLTDCTSGFKCFRRRVFERIPLNAIRTTGYDFQVDINVRCHWKGFLFKEIPIVFSNRSQGISKLTRRDVLNGARELLWIGLLSCVRGFRLGR